MSKVDSGRFHAWIREEAGKPGGPGADLMERWRREGRTSCQRQNILVFETLEPDVFHFNQTRVLDVDATDPASLTRGSAEALRQVGEMVALLREEVPGLERAVLERVAPQLGIRESRRIMGDYVMTADDCLSGAKFPDGVVRACYPLDIHSPTGPGTVMRRLPPGADYEVPYRCMLPRGLENVIVAGRPVSATHEAHASIRIMPTCAGLGEAAGAAAALAREAGRTPRELDPDSLRRSLVEGGASLERD
jgi:hypothetical protein